MEENELLQIARMVHDNNVPTTEQQLPVVDDKQDGRFIHPDDVRGHAVDTMHTTLKHPDTQGTGPIVLVTTDAALRMVPSVRSLQPVCLQRMTQARRYGPSPNLFICTVKVTDRRWTIVRHRESVHN